MVVIKRDGRLEEFKYGKIYDAIKNAFIEVDGVLGANASQKAYAIARQIESLDKDLDVESIQDLVEERLMASNRKDVARAYIIYRNDRNRARAKGDSFNKILTEKIMASNVENQNANVDEHSFGGRIGAVAGETMKRYALDHCMSEMMRNNHLNNEVYVHDLDHYAVGDHNCLSVPFDKLLANGFNTRQTDVRPAQSVSTAFQLVAVIFQLQSLQQFGGVSATHLDWTMVPYVRKSFYKHFVEGWTYIEDSPDIEPELASYKERSICDEFYKAYPKAYKYAMDMTEKEVYQAVEGMYHNLK